MASTTALTALNAANSATTVQSSMSFRAAIRTNLMRAIASALVPSRYSNGTRSALVAGPIFVTRA